MKISLKLTKSTLQYIMLYFMIIVNQSCLYQYFLSGTRAQFIIVAVLLIPFLVKYKKNASIIIILAVLMAYIVAVRFIAGGVGILLWIMNAIPILIVVDTIDIKPQKFLTRTVKIVSFFAAVSIIFFAVQIVAPDILRNVLKSYDTEFTIGGLQGMQYVYTHLRGYGLFFYSVRESGNFITRNKGLFTEPGICQIVYNSALFMLLFMHKDLEITDKQRRNYILIVLVALLTVQSTTGYLIMILFITVYAMSNSDRLRGKKFVGHIIWIGIIIILFDVVRRGEDSFFIGTIVKKMFSEDGGLQVQASGMYRVNASTISFMQMISHPLGIGYDKISEMLAVSTQAGGGGGIFKFGATLGVIPFITVVVLYAYPIFANKKMLFSNRLVLFAFCMICMTAQSSVAYTFLILFPIYFWKKSRIIEREMPKL